MKLFAASKLGTYMYCSVPIDSSSSYWLPSSVYRVGRLNRWTPPELERGPCQASESLSIVRSHKIASIPSYLTSQSHITHHTSHKSHRSTLPTNWQPSSPPPDNPAPYRGRHPELAPNRDFLPSHVSPLPPRASNYPVEMPPMPSNRGGPQAPSAFDKCT